MKKIFGLAGILATRLHGYEPRTGQEEMAQAVHDLLGAAEEPGFGDQALSLVVEAETGLGKTLAYLIPAALSGKRVVVSTNTKNLQDQILKHEIPFIIQTIKPELKALCVKGRQNYLCLSRWHQFLAAHKPSLFENETFSRINDWLARTTFAEKSEFPAPGAETFSLWPRICCQSHLCLGSDCPHHGGCFLNRLRREAAASQLLIVNHHLLFSDLAVRKGGYGEVLPRYEAVIFDEAHHIENVATNFFGFSFSRYQVLDLAGDIERSSNQSGRSPQSVQAVETAQTAIAQTERLGALLPQERGRFELPRQLLESREIQEARDGVAQTLNRLADLLENFSDQAEPWEHYGLRSRELAARLETITAFHFDDLPESEIRYVHWYERSDKNMTLTATPIEIAADLHQTLFQQVGCCVFTSATLSAGGNFNYFFNRIGLTADTPTLRFPSPFDYRNKTLLYIPDKPFPEPNDSAYPAALHQKIEQLLTISRGRALVLFTSYRAMETAFHQLGHTFDFPVYRQGTAPRHELLTSFTKDTNSVLFAVSSFWEGVDVPGDTLSLVIIDKLPFEVPSDPVIMARMNRIKSAGGNPFFDFQVPRAILTLRQGVGRLMRRIDDHGVIAVLDIRLYSKRYGGRFLESLPPSPVARDLAAVETFFSDR